MAEGWLFDVSGTPAPLRALSHAGDPETSAGAVAGLDASGARAAHLRAVLAAVRDHPGLTACELMEFAGLAEYQVRRRLTDLKNAGRVVQGEARTCRVKGTRMMTWRVA